MRRPLPTSATHGMRSLHRQLCCMPPTSLSRSPRPGLVRPPREKPHFRLPRPRSKLEAPLCFSPGVSTPDEGAGAKPSRQRSRTHGSRSCSSRSTPLLHLGRGRVERGSDLQSGVSGLLSSTADLRTCVRHVPDLRPECQHHSS